MNKKMKIGALSLLAAASVASATATPTFDSLQTDITASVSTYETVALGVLGISVGVVIVGMVIRWLRKASK